MDCDLGLQPGSHGLAYLADEPNAAAVWGQEVERPLHDRFDGDNAYAILKQLCDLGPRPTGSAPMTQQIEMLEGFFEKLGWETVRQSFELPHWRFDEPVEVTNLIVRHQPEGARAYPSLLPLRHPTLPRA